MRTLILTAITLVLLGCSHNVDVKAPDAVLIPEDVILSGESIAQLKKQSSEGDGESSYRLFEYYAYNTSEYEVALQYAELALTQGVERAAKDIKYMKDALGLP